MFICIKKNCFTFTFPGEKLVHAKDSALKSASFTSIQNAKNEQGSDLIKIT
jgi:hypothetical protein